MRRTAKHQLRNEMVSASHAEACLRRDPANIDGNIAGGIAAADDQNTLASERLRALEIACMQSLPRKGPLHMRYKGIAVMPRTHDQIVENLLPGTLSV